MTPNDKVKTLINSSQNVFLAVEDSFSDGKFDFSDAFKLLPPLMAAGEVVKDFSATKDQFINADEESRADILKHAQNVINFKNDKSEAITEAILGMVIYGGALIGLMKAAPGNDAPDA